MTEQGKITSFSKNHFYFLSNFYPCEIEFDGHKYRSVDHAYQAAKCEDDEHLGRSYFRLMPNPLHSRGFRKDFYRKKSNWNDLRDAVMEELLRTKFKDEILRRKLLETEDREIVAESTQIWHRTRHDMYWGVCVCSKHKSTGQNKLGELLMKIRAEMGICDNISNSFSDMKIKK